MERHGNDTSTRIFAWLAGLGVHVGSDLSRGYNQQFNEHLVGVVRRHEAHAIPTASRYRWRDALAAERTRRIPIINISSCVTSLRSALSFVQKLGHHGGSILYYHPDLYDNSFYVYTFARAVRETPHSLYHTHWLNGTITNYYGCFFDFIRLLYEHEQIQLKEKITFISMLLRMLIYTCFMVPTDKTWEKHFADNAPSWRAVVFLRYFKYYYRIPSIIVTLNPANRNRAGIVTEGGRLGVPVVSTVDTDGSFNSVTYPILSNDDSFLLCVLYFNIFNSAYEIGRSHRYRKIFARSMKAMTFEEHRRLTKVLYGAAHKHSLRHCQSRNVRKPQRRAALPETDRLQRANDKHGQRRQRPGR